MKAANTVAFELALMEADVISPFDREIKSLSTLLRKGGPAIWSERDWEEGLLLGYRTLEEGYLRTRAALEENLLVLLQQRQAFMA